MTSQKTLLGLAASAMLLGAVGAAQATTYVSGAQNAASITTDGATAVVTQVAIAPTQTGTPSGSAGTPGNASGNAFVITGGQVPGAYSQLGANGVPGDSTAKWVTGYVGGSNGNFDTDYLFTQKFTVANPSNGPVLLTGDALSDNDLLSITVKDLDLNVSQVIYSAPGANAGQDGTASYTTALAFGGSGAAPSGNYALIFDVHNQHNIGQGYNPISLEDSFSVNPVPEPGSLASFAFGGVGLLGLALRARKGARAAA